MGGHGTTFFGSAFLAAGIFLMALALALGRRYMHERNHASGAGSGCGLAFLLTLGTFGAVGLFIGGHIRDSRHFCNVLADGLRAHASAAPVVSGIKTVEIV